MGDFLVSTVMCALTEAFDCVNISALLLKMDYYDIREKEFELFSSYLNNRKQYVINGGNRSGLIPISEGLNSC